MHLIQGLCYQRGSPCQDPAGNRTKRRPPDHGNETQTAVVWSCFPFIRSGQNHPARQSEWGRRQGRQKNRWEDNIRERTGLEFAKSQRAVENRERWRKLVAKSSVMPQLSSRLRDRLDNEMKESTLCADSYSVSVPHPCHRNTT